MEINNEQIKTPAKIEPETISSEIPEQKEVSEFDESLEISRLHGIKLTSKSYPINYLGGFAIELLSNPEIKKYLGSTENVKTHYV